MGNSEEPNKPSTLYDSSSQTQALLSKPYPSSIEETHNDSIESDQNQYLQISYNYGPRQFRDLPFLILFILLVVATFAFGIYCIVNRNNDYSNLSSYVYDSSSSACVSKESSASIGGKFDQMFRLQNLSFYTSSSYSAHFLKDLIWTLVITAILSVPFTLGILLLLKHYTKQLVYATLPFFVILPIFFNIYWFVACTYSSSCSDSFPLAYRILVLVFVFLIIGAVVWILVANWNRVELTVRVIGVASYAMSRNLSLFGVLPCLIIGLLVYYAPIVVFLVFARFNGEIEATESDGEYSCEWNQDTWVPAYYALAIVTMLWSATAMLEAQVYVISGTVAQWYFSKDDLKPRWSIRSSLR